MGGGQGLDFAPAESVPRPILGGTVPVMERQKRSREDWVTEGLAHLGDVGVDKVRVDRIAATLGVPTGSFYWHFKDRGELLAAIVDGWEDRYTEQLIGQVDSAGLDAQAKGRRLWDVTAHDPIIQAELAIRDWARRDESVAARVRQVDDRRLRYLETLLGDLDFAPAEVPARSLLLYALLFSDSLITATDPEAEAAHRKTVADALEFLLRPT